MLFAWKRYSKSSELIFSLHFGVNCRIESMAYLRGGGHDLLKRVPKCNGVLPDSSVARGVPEGASAPDAAFLGRIFRIISQKKEDFSQEDIKKSLREGACCSISLGCPGRGPPQRHHCCQTPLTIMTEEADGAHREFDFNEFRKHTESHCPSV